ncbi:hypothetical protein HYALB_00009155 [Hymenoscyphus albidus]|uniref:Uncharacterized protein n=1 Tax=Hymenoscyphus albidus TaxID=595503 RepID=A0A9N9LR01_9HELO|nr:hypothetical protein HYALB_00009155 [Hymenoscyphus albidus]
MSETSKDRLRAPYSHDVQSSDLSRLSSTSNVSLRTTLADDGNSGRTPNPDINNEKHTTVLFVDDKGEENYEEAVPDDDPLLRDIPWQVRRVISLDDDPNTHVITFRYFFMTLLFIAPAQQFRTTHAPYSIFFVQIATNYLGDWMARYLPAREIRLPFTKKCFSLNPGPFSSKEHTMVTISASSGATYNMAFLPISIAELFFDTRIKTMVALPFMWAVVILGYGYAAIARQFLIHDPQYPCYLYRLVTNYTRYQALCQTALFETQKRQRQSPSPVSRRQMTIFFLVLGGVTLWQFLPEFVFPFLQSLSILCWMAPQNKTLNFIGGGLGGMGVLNFSLDWSSISAFGKAGSLFLTPWWTQLIVYLGFVVNCWIMLPLAKWGGIGGWSKYLMSNRRYTVNGTTYPVDQIMTSQSSLNETAYAELGPLYMSTQLRWGMFFDFASYSSAMVWMAIFGYPAIKSAWLKFKDRSSNGRRKPVSEQYPDQLNVLMRNYKEVPLSWFMVLIGSAFLVIMTVVAKTDLYIPWWTVLVAMSTGAVVVVPLGWLYSMSNFQLPVGTTNELLYGLMVNSVDGYKHPVGAFVYSTIAGDAWYRAQIMLQDQKIGHYMLIPPRAVFFSQVFGSTIGVPINYGVVRWVLNLKFDYVSGKLVDPAR